MITVPFMATFILVPYSIPPTFNTYCIQKKEACQHRVSLVVMSRKLEIYELQLSEYLPICHLLSVPLSASDGVQDRGVGDLGLHREQSRGGYSLGGAISPVARGPPAAVSLPQCQSAEEAKLCIFPRCLMELSSSFLWPPWWPPQWPTVPAAPGTPSGSSSRCASGGSRGLLMVRVGGADRCPLLSGHKDEYCNSL